MDKTISLLGGVVGGWFLTNLSLHGQFLSALNPLFSIVGTVSIVVFSGLLIYKAFKG